MWLDIYFVKHVLEFLTLIYVRIKSDVITLENYDNIVDDILVSVTCRQIWSFLLMCRSHDVRHAGFRRLTVVNGTPGKWGVTKNVKQNCDLES